MKILILQEFIYRKQKIFFSMQISDDFKLLYIISYNIYNIFERTFVFVDKDVTEPCSSPLMQIDEFPTELQLLLLLYLSR